MSEKDMAQKIKDLRLSQNLTLEQVANEVGVGKSTVRKWETGMIPFTGSVRKSRMAEYKKQEAAYEQTFRSGKCTFGDMNYKRHRDVRYSNEYPAGCRCPHCGTFWID